MPFLLSHSVSFLKTGKAIVFLSLPTAVLEIKNLKVRISGKTILKNVHLTANNGEITGIVGRSGSGKSTLFRSILAVPELIQGYEIEGEIKWKGRDVREYSTKPIQPVFQDPFSFLSPYQTLGESLLEPLQVREGIFLSKKRKSEETDRILSYFERFHLKEEVLSKRTNQLSGGQLQRLSILRAILARPELILLDEPVTALDALVQAEIVSLIRNLNEKENISFLLVSHDLGLVKHLCKQVFLLEQGEVVESGEASEVFTRPKTEFTKELIASRNLKDI
ncbi:ABC transporter ATP-binding protein [Leptospira idonii]|uniref:ABC transporter ATP-binding protein n=1 Tax=Leptospira idonii TaxID=1193500 RepID=UPI0014383BC8|nr:dipeptide/oligopeptide/nickel ABC transporter ATP-binding protein [Leptospira idonii]